MSHPLSRRIVKAPRRVVLLLTLLLAPGLTLAADDPPDNAGGAKLSRVVVAGGSLTEILYALHLQDHIAAVDTTSLFPSEALKAKPNIGYVRALSAEGILALGPSLLLAIEGAGPPGTLDVIRSAGVSVVTVPDDPSQTGIARKIEDIGHMFGADAPAQSLTREVTAAFASLATSRGRIAHPKRVLFVLSLQNGRSMVGGRKTSADGMIQLAGGINAAGEIEGFKPMSDEAILAAAPDVVLTMQNAGPAVTADALFALPAYAGTPAGQSRSLVSMDGLLLLGFGPRTPEAAQYLLTVLLPRPDLCKTLKPFRRVGAELGSDRAPSVRRIGIVVLSIASAAAATLASVGYGAVSIPPGRVAAIFWATLTGSPDLSAASDTLILTAIRLPRTVLGLLVGAALGISGTLLQGLFRNPLADPGLVGVSAGAALATAATIVLGDRWLGTISGAATLAALPVAAFLGGLITTLLLYAIATRQGRTSVATMLLAGIALAALAGSATGLLIYLSNDRQLRDLTFWSLGSLGGATWAKVVIAAVFILPVATVVPSLSRSLNALALGEAEAFHMGVAVERTKRSLIVLVALAVGAAVAMTGPIGFIGLVVPHLIRLLAGSDHHVELPVSGILGAAVLVAADTMARTIAAPADVPIGILTAALGAPVFLWLLLSRIGGTDR